MRRPCALEARPSPRASLPERVASRPARRGRFPPPRETHEPYKTRRLALGAVSSPLPARRALRLTPPRRRRRRRVLSARRRARALRRVFSEQCFSYSRRRARRGRTRDARAHRTRRSRRRARSKRLRRRRRRERLRRRRQRFSRGVVPPRAYGFQSRRAARSIATPTRAPRVLSSPNERARRVIPREARFRGGTPARRRRARPPSRTRRLAVSSSTRRFASWTFRVAFRARDPSVARASSTQPARASASRFQSRTALSTSAPRAPRASPRCARAPTSRRLSTRKTSS